MKYQMTAFELFLASLYLTLHEAWKYRIVRLLIRFLFIFTIAFFCIFGTLTPVRILLPLGLFYLVYVMRAYRGYRAEGLLEPTEITIEGSCLNVSRQTARTYSPKSLTAVREYLGILFLFWRQEQQGYFLMIPCRVFRDKAQKLEFLHRFREMISGSSSEDAAPEHSGQEQTFDHNMQTEQEGPGHSALLAWKKMWGIRPLRAGVLLLTAAAFAGSLFLGSGALLGSCLAALIVLLAIVWTVFFSLTWKEQPGVPGQLPLRNRLTAAGLAVIAAILVFYRPQFSPVQGEIKPMTMEQQIQVLKELNLTVPEIDQDSLKDMDPDVRTYMEENPFYGLLTGCGIPKRDQETMEVTGYSEQAYWFDFEGWDIATDYIEILKGVQALAGDSLAITDMEEDINGVQWEEGTGIIPVTFRINGTAYLYQAKMENDWIDPEFLVFLKESLDKEQDTRHLYLCPDNGQGCILFYRTAEWAEEFRNKTGIPLH